MHIFAIADLHLSGDPPFKPMSVFGEHWHNHWAKIKADWLEKVTPDDIVLLPGDISWAMKLEEALPDLRAIDALPGRKVIVRGNHDYWWQTVSKMTRVVGGQITFLHNTFTPAGSFAICGSRGWTCPGDRSFAEAEDMPIYLRELNRVRATLTAAVQAGYRRYILMLHYPPVNDRHEPSGFTDLMAEFGVEICVFGHLHDEAIRTAPTGIFGGAACYLVSCDALDFKLKCIV